MGKTIDETVKEVMSDKKLLEELLADMDDPSKVASFLKEQGCDGSVKDFIDRLDSYN
ncbi:MAG: hypothetical protein IK093_02150 [Ruminiclostridium sp.]|nr:hypothetical protein [Ruminiclostridium sp.]